MSRTELILYATPVGPLADEIDAVFAQIAARSPTTAQAYPPHVTLTGFFHRRDVQIHGLVDAVRASAVGTTTAVEIVRLQVGQDWIGLELQSPELLARSERFAAALDLGPGDDPLRLKDWLHLSIAYGDGDIAHAAEIAADLDLTLDVEWHVGLWQRSDQQWIALSAPD